MQRPLCAILALALCLAGAALADEAALLDTYEPISPLGNGFCTVRQGGLWGIVDESGAVALEPQLEEEPVFEGGCAVVSSMKGRPRMLSGVIGGEYEGVHGVIDERARRCCPARTTTWSWATAARRWCASTNPPSRAASTPATAASA